MARPADTAKALARTGGKPGKAATAAPPPARSGGSWNWLAGMGCGAALAFATPSFVLGAVLLAPALVTAAFERERGRPMTRVVLVAGSGFALVPVWHLNQAGATMAAALDMLSDVRIVCPAWLAGACGWAACELLPMAIRFAADKRAAMQIAALTAEAEALRAAWDLEAEL